MRVGLTGNIGSGKTTVCRLFEILNVPVYYADDRGKHFLNSDEVAKEIFAKFGAGYLMEDGRPDKKKLAGLVFKNKKKLDELNALIHPKVQADFEEWVAAQKDYNYVIMEAAILFETKRNESFDKIILVTAPEKLRIQRVCERDKVSENEVISRMKNQWDEEKKIPLADFVIQNDEKELLMPRIEKIHYQLINISAS